MINAPFFQQLCRYADISKTTKKKKCNSFKCLAHRLDINVDISMCFQKHHYRELSPQAQSNLGEIPNEFTEYWLSRFPRLLCHVWCAMQNFRNESSLKQYYHPHYTFASAYEKQEAAIVRTNRVKNALSTSTRTGQKDSSVDWSPNRTRYRGQRRRQEKKKQEEPSTWLLNPSNSTTCVATSIN